MLILRSLAFFLVLFNLTTEGAAFGACRGTRGAIRDIVNRNARVSANDYAFTHARDLASYQRNLGPEFSASLKDANWLDLGGGMGLATLDRASTSAAGRATVVNAQDFWRIILRPLPGDRFLIEQKRETFLKMLKTLRLKTDDIFVQVGRERHFLNGWQEKMISRLSGARKDMIELGKWKYEVGFAEQVLPTLNQKYDLLSDVYGPYFYSGDRLRLLDEYYRSLKPGGKGFVIFQAHDLHLNPHTQRTEIRIQGPVNTVHLPNETPILYEDYLVKKFPKIFKIIEAGNEINRTKILVLQKDNVKDLDLKSLLKIEANFFGTDENTVMHHVPSSYLSPIQTSN